MENIIYRSYARIGARRFLQELLIGIGEVDPVHETLISENIVKSRKINKNKFDDLLNIIYRYCKEQGLDAKIMSGDYIHMVDDIRRETKYYIKKWEYSCKSQQEAFDKVYSRSDVMAYYMNGLLISQLLWYHHFEMLSWFKGNISSKGSKVLEIGAGHGLFSWITQSDHPCEIDIYDVSDVALDITIKMLGDKASYSTTWPDKKYDLILLGEVLEHLDNPLEMIINIKDLLTDNGILWLTVPTNAPAIDHVYLFNNKEEVFELIKKSGLKIVSRHITAADFMTELIGIFCRK